MRYEVSLYDNGLKIIVDRNTTMVQKEPTSKFIKVRCPKCKNEQIIFGKSASYVKCLVCENELGQPTGGKTRLNAQVLEVLG